jgi:hypothetical protein
MPDTHAAKIIAASMGALQNERGLPALKSSYFSVEERSTRYWLEYLRKFSHNIRFYPTATGKKSGNWSGAFPSDELLTVLLDYMAATKGGHNPPSMVSNQQQVETVQQLMARPDMALLLSFLDILEHPQQQFHQLTEKHQQFYYRQVLGLTERAPVPDRCHLVVQLHEDTPSLTLEEGIGFNAGKDAEGKDLSYLTVQNSVINQATVSRVSTLTHFEALSIREIESSPPDASKFLLTHLYDADDGIEFPGAGGLTFGESELQDHERQRYPLMGFVITSPILWLKEGMRRIDVMFDQRFIVKARDIMHGKGSPEQWGKMSTWFDIVISTSEGPQALNRSDTIDERVSVSPVYSDEGFESGFTLQFNPLFPAIVAGDVAGNVSGDVAVDKTQNSPSISLSIKPHLVALTQYDELNDLEIEHITMNVQVEGAKALKLYNQSFNIDVNKPFEPFGSAPRLKSQLYFTHPELLSKTVVSASLNIEWLDKPVDFSRFYKPYSYYRYCEMNLPDATDYLSDIPTDSGVLDSDGNAKFCDQLTKEELLQEDCDCLLWPSSKVRLHASHHILLSQTLQPLFDTEQTRVHSTIDLSDVRFNEIVEQDYQQLPLEEADPLLWPQWFAMELSHNDFGHQDYSRVAEYFNYFNANRINNAAIEQASAEGQSNNTQTQPELIQVPPAYTPLINLMTLDYQATATIHVAQAGPGQRHQIQLIHPMGQQHLVNSKRAGPYPIVPSLAHNGYLYIGLANMPIPGQVNLYFQLEPIDNTNISSSSLLQWSYLDNHRWTKFLLGKGDPNGKRGAILQDATNELLDSGIISFDLPESATQDSQFMGENRVWLRATLVDSLTHSAAPFYSVIKGIYAQGVQLVFHSVDNADSHLEAPLPAQSVKSLVQADIRIASVEQPYPSFGGKVKENSQRFAIRASEQLRHKGRALTAWDYEHLMLSTFPELHSVRCVRSLAQQTGDSHQVDVVVVPKTHDPTMLQPKVPLYLKRHMHEFIASVAPGNTLINVADPIYESVTFDIQISIREGFDAGTQAKKLNTILVEVLTPWNVSSKNADNTPSPLQQDGCISSAAVVAFLETQISVDVILGLSAYRQNATGGREYYPGSVLCPRDSHTILVPARHHEINIFSTTNTIFQGVGAMEIELDYIVA